MDNIFEMGTTARHGDLLDGFSYYTFEYSRRKELQKFTESVSLVYNGSKKYPANCELIGNC